MSDLAKLLVGQLWRFPAMFSRRKKVFTIVAAHSAIEHSVAWQGYVHFAISRKIESLSQGRIGPQDEYRMVALFHL